MAAIDIYNTPMEELMRIKKGNPRIKQSLMQKVGNVFVPHLFPDIPRTPMFALRVSPEGAYSVSRPETSNKILAQIKEQYIKIRPFKNVRIMDATRNNGGDTIRFGLDEGVSNVISVEIVPENFHI